MNPILMKRKKSKIDPYIHWTADYCKHCFTCIHVCPVENLRFEMDSMVSEQKCIQCLLCMKYYPDFALEVKAKK